jgi:hypothetical protein
MGYIVINPSSVFWLLVSSPFVGVYFRGKNVSGMAMAVYGFLLRTLQWLCRTTQAIVSAIFIYGPKLVSLTRTILCECLCLKVRSTLWWSVAILKSPFILTSAILEILEDDLWHHM